MQIARPAMFFGTKKVAISRFFDSKVFAFVQGNSASFQPFLGGGFKPFFFTPTWGNGENWLIFFRWVETTNQFFWDRFKKVTNWIIGRSLVWFLLMFFVATGYKLLGDDTEMSKWILFPHQWEPSVGTYIFFELRIKGMIKHLAVQVWLVSDGFQDICWGLLSQNTLPKTTRWWQLKHFVLHRENWGRWTQFWQSYFLDGLGNQPPTWPNIYPEFNGALGNDPFGLGFGNKNLPLSMSTKIFCQVMKKFVTFCFIP